MNKTIDVLVAGGGAAGLATGLALARAGLTVTIAGMPETIRDDARSAALFASSFAFLDRIGAGDRLRAKGWPLRAIRIVDVTGALVRSPTTTFKAIEIGEPAFGWNIANAEILAELIAMAKETPGITLLPALVSSHRVAGGNIIAALADGSKITARLLIGADGQKSSVRQVAGIKARIKPYRQVAITARATHARDHDDISTEFHTRQGPLTFVPSGEKRSAIVWLMRPEEADRRLALPLAEFTREMERMSGHFLGPLTLEGPQGRVPMQKLVAEHLVAARVALVGEAAHAFPPIGAQGLNLGFRDCDALGKRVSEAFRAGRDIGSEEVLAAYARDRKMDVEARSAGVDILNTAIIGNLLPLDLARAAGLSLFNAVPPLRRLAMRLGGGMPVFGAK
ncbi:MAG: FAD-dependent monooxygenase [Methylobacterium sp.]|nr:FAD-dependent monooxygenase [Methylobacterium sp.]MCA3661962.1 FAD-dependent monooxygenase [Methylobacterium sp.]MCA3666668.1 FAD-dependent monooxygenase [Methylobacterium sp.]MCA3667966.1 FAD-dependent monooxygenase [Methylobacterium sp.]MCA3672044.1 FAD-dependent monooxygenase [Methylobacterium sp.]